MGNSLSRLGALHIGPHMSRRRCQRVVFLGVEGETSRSHDRRMADVAVQVDLAGPKDLEWLVAVDSHVRRSWVERCVDLGEYLVARSNGQAAGFLRHSMFWGVIPFMDLIYVEPAMRRRGVGSLLLQAWEDEMVSRRAPVLMTSSMSDEPEPQIWHERHGFSRSGSLTFGTYQSTPEVFFVKSLQGG